MRALLEPLWLLLNYQIFRAGWSNPRVRRGYLFVENAEATGGNRVSKGGR